MKTLNINQEGINLIKTFEGVRLHAYRDAVNVLTIGYGHTGNVKQGQVITMKQAEDILNKDLERFVDGVNELVKVEVNQHQFNALVSLSFNVGLGNLEKSTLLKLVNQKEFGRASLEFTKWNKAGGKVLAGLTRRRQAESKMFTTPVPVVKPKPKAVYHTVVKGENLTVIGMKFKQSLPTILKLNPSIKDPHTIKIGQRIRVK